MDERIRSRKPIRHGQSGSYSPSHGSPIRRSGRHLSPNLSGSDDDEDNRELMELDNCPNTTASTNSTLNSSSDVADGGDCMKVRHIRTDVQARYYRDGQVRELKYTKTEKKVDIPKKEAPSNNNSAVLWIGAIVIVAVIAILYNSQASADHKTMQRLRCSFEHLERQFPKQNKILWKSLEKGVESVINDIPTIPSIFLLAYDDGYTANRITRSIVERTTECMDSQVNAVVLSPADLDGNEMKSDYGVVIAKYQNQLKKSGVMLVNDLNKIPSAVAPAFHTFCDVHNPLVDRSIIFLTLQFTNQIHSSSSSNTLALVENYLRSNWSELQNYVLDPLITRVTDQVFLLNNE